MGCFGGCGGNNCLWIIILLIIICCCGCGGADRSGGCNMPTPCDNSCGC